MTVERNQLIFVKNKLRFGLLHLKGNFAFRKEEGPDCRDRSCGSAVKVHYTMLFH